MNEYLGPVSYEVKTKNLMIKNNLDVMFEKYGINDYALSTITSWRYGSLEIYPVEEKPSERSIVSYTIRKLKDLYFEY
jgi:hypothetical protein